MANLVDDPRPAPALAGGPPTPSRPLVARLEGVVRRYRRGAAEVAALAGVDLEVRAGELIAVVGPSGGGKSTLLNVLSGVDTVDEGRVELCGQDLSRATEADLVRLRRSHVGVVFQAFHLMPNLSAMENVALPLALAGMRDDARVKALLERVGLGHRLTHFPAEMSGGEEQRVAIARALVHRPELVVADEPTGNLDSKNGAEVLALLDEVRREEGAALVVATHDATVAERADRVLRMRDGRMSED